jgi:DNA mismatch endonuclease (patch repair protein)
MKSCSGNPNSNVEFWDEKLTRNAERDAEKQAQLEANGWRVLTVWECELKTKSRGATLHRLTGEILEPDYMLSADYLR